MTGEITQVNLARGFGFIRSHESRDKIFFHVKQLAGLPFDETLHGQRVEFVLEETEKGPKATAVRAVGEGA